MSKIEAALKKLRIGQLPEAGSPSAAAGSQRQTVAGSVVPAAVKKKVTVEGAKYHVNQEDLVQGGLLLSPDQAGRVEDEFRKIKRPLIDNIANADSAGGQHMNVIMIASGMPRAGKTFCAVNLAVSMSLERELNVLLVDADIPKPHISREFGLATAPGLIDLLVDESYDLADLLVRTDLNDIQVLPAGRRHTHATELLASARMSRIVHELALRYPDRIVILDSPPLLVTTEAQALASQVGQIVLVVEAGETSQQVLTQTIETLDSSKAINLLLNKTRHGSNLRYGGYYGYERG